MEKPNLTYIKELSDGDIAYENKILGIIITELKTDVDFYNKSHKNLSYKDMAAITHKLKNKIGIFGLEKGSVLAKDHENNLRNNNLELHDEFLSILEKIKVFTEKL